MMTSFASIELRIESPPELSAVRAGLQSIDLRRVPDIATLIGVDSSGRSIQVELVPESFNVARTTPPWVAGFTTRDNVVIFPSRSPTYPSNTLEDVLRHEIVHALIWRASGGQSVPRWFNEGLAMEAERERQLGDQSRLLYQLVSGSRASLAELDRLFDGGENDQSRAYALSSALVHDILQRHGSSVGAQILERMRGGMTFDEAFSKVVGVLPATAENQFWDRQRIWTNWVPILGSTTMLWIVVTLLALIAIYRRSRLDREIEKRWEKEDSEDEP